MKCLDCGNVISPSADSCYYCGRPIIKREPKFRAFLVTVVLLAFNLVVITGGLEYGASTHIASEGRLLPTLHNLFSTTTGPGLFAIWVVANLVLLKFAWDLNHKKPVIKQ